MIKFFLFWCFFLAQIFFSGCSLLGDLPDGHWRQFIRTSFFHTCLSGRFDKWLYRLQFFSIWPWVASELRFKRCFCLIHFRIFRFQNALLNPICNFDYVVVVWLRFLWVIKYWLSDTFRWSFIVLCTSWNHIILQVFWSLGIYGCNWSLLLCLKSR